MVQRTQGGTPADTLSAVRAERSEVPHSAHTAHSALGSLSDSHRSERRQWNAAPARLAVAVPRTPRSTNHEHDQQRASQQPALDSRGAWSHAPGADSVAPESGPPNCNSERTTVYSTLRTGSRASGRHHTSRGERAETRECTDHHARPVRSVSGSEVCFQAFEVLRKVIRAHAAAATFSHGTQSIEEPAL